MGQFNKFIIFNKNPKNGTIYNIGGGRESNISILEAIKKCQELTKNKFEHTYTPKERIGDHKFWITDMTKFKSYFPKWRKMYDFEKLMKGFA